MILPKKGTETTITNDSAKTKINSSNGSNPGKETVTGMKNLDIGKDGVKLDLSEVEYDINENTQWYFVLKINLEERMKCTGQELFNALTQKDMIQVILKL